MNSGLLVGPAVGEALQDVVPGPDLARHAGEILHAVELTRAAVAHVVAVHVIPDTKARLDPGRFIPWGKYVGSAGGQRLGRMSLLTRVFKSRATITTGQGVVMAPVTDAGAARRFASSRP